MKAIQQTPKVPLHFDSLSIQQMQNIERNAILKNNNGVRFEALRAAQGVQSAQRTIIAFLRENPDWLLP